MRRALESRLGRGSSGPGIILGTQLPKFAIMWLGCGVTVGAHLRLGAVETRADVAKVAQGDTRNSVRSFEVQLELFDTKLGGLKSLVEGQLS